MTVVLQVRLRRDEAKSIREAAARSGVTVADWVRTKLLAVVDGPDAGR